MQLEPLNAMTLSGIKIAILATDGFEQPELTEPKRMLTAVGAEVLVVSPAGEQIRAWNHSDWGITVMVDKQLERVDAYQFDALILPGGVINPDRLRINPLALKFVKHFFDEKKPVAAICHGPWTLINADVVRERRMTSWPSLRVDLENAGALWQDEAVVCDDHLITSRKPDDLPLFNHALITMLADQAPVRVL
jgi:protease I